MSSGAGYLFGSFRIDVSRRILLRAGEPVPITGKAFDTLLFLVEHRDRIVSKDELLEGVWVDATVEEANLTQTISVLRRALGERPGENKYIVTVSGRGYQFAAAVEQSDRAHPVAAMGSRRVILLGALLTLIAVAFGVSKLRLSGEIHPTTVRLTALPGEETQPAFSPDGKQIAFAWNGEAGDNQNIYISLVGIGAKLRLTSHPANDSSPAWSPDGQYIAFHRNSARPGYFIIPAIGGPERLVAEVEPGAKSNGRKVAWSPDGKSLVITRPNLDAPRQIVAVSLTNGQRRVLTQPPEMPGDEDPAISPDGSQLAFVRGFVRLIVTQLDGTGERQIATAPGIRGITWTADGNEVIYASMQTSGNNLWKVAASGLRAPELIAGVSGDVAFPSISSNGRRLIYSESRINENIWRLSLESEALDRRLIYSTKSQFAPQLSPDGRRIAFISDRGGSLEVWISDQDGQNVRQLTFHGGAHVGTPRWSPDSRLIVYDMLTGNDPDIYQVAAEGGASRNLTNHPKLDNTPSYSRDGRWIYFSSNRSGAFQVWRMPAAGGEALPLTRNGGAVPMEAANGFVYYTRFGVEDPGLLRVPAKGGEETAVVPGVGAWGWWALSNEGVYFLERDRLANGVKLQFAPFSGQARTVRVLPRIPSDAENVLSVDRAGQLVLLQQIDERIGDLVMVEGFR